jgi:nucleoside-diphosphate-sugar epimerase
LKNEPIVILGTGNDKRSFCYVADNITAQFKILLSEKNGEVFNVGNPDEISIFELAQELKEISGSESEVIRKTSEDKDYTTDNPKRRCPDISKIKSELSWSPVIDLQSGLKRTFEWHSQNKK